MTDTNTLILLAIVLAVLAILVYRAIQSIKINKAINKAKKEIAPKVEAIFHGQATQDLADEIKAYTKKHDIESYPHELLSSIITQAFHNELEPIHQSQRYSDADKKRLHKFLRKVSKIQKFFCKIQIPQEYPKDLDTYRALWVYEAKGELELPPIHTIPLGLQSPEHTYYSFSAIWCKDKVFKVRRGHAGGRMSFRVAKGLSFSVGSYTPVYDTYTDLQEISEGTAYITNKRIVFLGSQRSTNITYKTLLDLNFYSDGIEIHKTSGAPIFLQTDIPLPELQLIQYILHEAIHRT